MFLIVSLWLTGLNHIITNDTGLHRNLTIRQVLILFLADGKNLKQNLFSSCVLKELKKRFTLRVTSTMISSLFRTFRQS